MKDSQSILAIDLGTSGPKVALYSGEGRLQCHTVEKTPVYLLPEGGAEQDPEDWWQAIRRGVRRLLEENAISPEQVGALCCTGQWSGTVPLDEGGKPLMNAIIWMDTRGAPYIQRVNRGLVNIAGYGIAKLWTWIRLTGGAPTHSGKDPIAHILWLKHERPEIYRNTYKFLEPKDYLNFRLTGRYAATFDSITLHWVTDNRDLGRVRYDDRLLKLVGLEREKLPELVQAVDVLGPLTPEAAADLGLHEEVQVIGGMPDLQSAAIGSGAVKDYQAHLYVGTSSWITCHFPHKKTDLFHNMGALPSAIPGRYFLANEQETAGGCLEYFVDSVIFAEDALATPGRPEDIYARLEELIAGVPAGSEKLIFTPWLYGERTPVDDERIRGGFHNMTLRTSRAHMVRAIYEGVAYNARWLLHYVEQFINRPIPELRFIGGGALSDAWCQIMADVLDRPILRVEEPRQANTRGAALLAAVATGRLGFADIPERVLVTDIFEPNPKHRQMYDELFAAFVEIYKRNQRIHADLNRHDVHA
ncbi:MAG: xylulose kinase [Caldilineae bacterium]|nr:MAG: xylulose kinase [Caldilineae bacterium]